MQLTKYDQPQRSKKQWYAIAEKNGISKCLFFNRLKQGWTERDAATVEKRDYKITKPVPKSKIAKLAEKSGLPYGTVYGRLKRGWSIKDTVTLPPNNKGQRAAKAKREVEHG